MGKIETLRLPEMGTHALGSEKLSVDPYISKEFFEREKKDLFAKCWLMAGREKDVMKTGEYIIFHLDALSVSLIIVRGRDKKLRAFYNACSHRGARLITESCGKARATIVCPYHGWSFGLDGTLAAVPDADTFASLDKKNENLRQVSVDIWGGFVFVNVDPQPEWTLREYLAPLDDGLERYLADPQWSWSYGWRSKVQSNWKLLVDPQIEGYHVDQAHRRTIAGNIASKGARPFAHPDSIGVPGGINLFRPEVLGVQTPVALLSAKYGATSLYSKPEKLFAANIAEGVLNDHHPLWVLDEWLLFPNTVMFVQKGQIFIQRTYPISADECMWEVDFYHAQPVEKFGQVFSDEQGRIQLRDVFSEDLFLSEGLQANYRAGAVTEISLSKQEVAVRAFYRNVMRFVGEAASAQAKEVR